MFKHYFERIENVELWPIISLIIFFVFFLLLIIYVLKADKRFIDYMKNLPLQDEENNNEDDNYKK